MIITIYIGGIKMKLHLTSGTYPYLSKIAEQHEDVLLYLATGRTRLIQENDGESIFTSPTSAEVIHSNGDLSDQDFIYYNYLPVSTDHESAFKKNVQQDIDTIESTNAYRIAKVLNDDAYIILVSFSSDELVKPFEESAFFNEYFNHAHAKRFKGTDLFHMSQHVEVLKPNQEEHLES